MDLKQFEIQILTLKNKVFRFAFYILSNREEAEDTVQEVFMKLWNMRNDLAKVHNIHAFVLKMTRNYCLDRLRSGQFQRNAVSPEQYEMQPERSANPHEAAEQKDLLATVKRIIATLPEMQRTIISLRDMEELEFNEIEAITGLNENAIKVNLSRARKKVREQLFNEKIWK